MSQLYQIIFYFYFINLTVETTFVGLEFENIHVLFKFSIDGLRLQFFQLKIFHGRGWRPIYKIQTYQNHCSTFHRIDAKLLFKRVIAALKWILSNMKFCTNIYQRGTFEIQMAKNNTHFLILNCLGPNLVGITFRLIIGHLKIYSSYVF